MPRGVRVSPASRVIRGGNYIVRFNTGRIVQRIGKGADKAMRQWASETTARYHQLLSPKGPPRSLPGQVPKRESGHLRSETRVKYIGGRNPRVEVRTAPHGKWLDEGTRKMAARPFIAKYVDKAGIERLVRQIKKATARELRK